MQSQILYSAVPRTCYLHLARIFISLFCSVFLVAGYGQSIPDALQQSVDSLIQSRTSSFIDVHKVLEGHRNDTLLMRYVANTSATNSFAAGQAYGLNELGRFYRNTSQYDRSIPLHLQALAIAEKADNLDFKVNSLNYLGVVYRRLSSIRKAMDYHHRALELALTVKNPSNSLKRGINISYNGIGNLYLMLKQYDQAITYFEKSLGLEAELGNILGLAINNQNIGQCLEAQGKLDEALERYRMSLAYNDQINSDDGRVICKTSMAQIHLKKNRTADALTLLEAALPVAQRLGDAFLIAPVYTDLGWAKMLVGRYGEAQQNLMKGLKLAEEDNLHGASARTSHLLSQLFQRTGDFKRALDFKLKADSIDSEILNEGTIRYVNEVLFRYNMEKAEKDMQLLNEEKERSQMELRTTKTTLLISGIALALLAGIFYILYRQYQLKNEKKLMALEQSMLRSQMNPHFLFNSLNSIKLYIINNEQKNAVHYLNKFSKLVRKILESSSVREIPLAEELETVELYMTIENIRFSNEIGFSIRVDNDVDTHTVRIPSLILQPFLENALWHGLSSKKGDKKLDLHVSREKHGRIQIAITDNGIGRAEAEKIKQNKVLKRKSVGIDITEERLANFAKDYQNTFQIEMVDLYDNNGQASGTRVVLHIPTT